MKSNTDKDRKSDTDRKPVKTVRRPKQQRSIEMKEKILDAALLLFCEKGYYNTTTNEIAQKAGVSIGSLYSYFKDKDTVFLEVLDQYHEKFDMAKEDLLKDTGLLLRDSRTWLRLLIENLIQVHEESKELNRELNVLSHYNPKIAEILEKQREKTLQSTVGYFITFQNNFHTEDMEATAIVIFDFISATVDRIVFGKNEIEKDRLINAAVDIIQNYYLSAVSKFSTRP